MKDLDSSILRTAPARAEPATRGGVIRAAQSILFLTCYLVYLTVVMGLGQRLVLWPLITLLPSRRERLVRRWLRAHARATLGLARALAGVRVETTGGIPADTGACVVAMNHQSVLDIPLGLTLIPGPYPLIPTRDRYRNGIPAISPLARLARFPFVSQRRVATRAELLALAEAARAVERGEHSLLIFPEGHRTHSGAIEPFMSSGLKLILSRAHRPVYCIVADGMVHMRTMADVALRFAGTRIGVIILGPFTPPERGTPATLDAFVEDLRTHMTAALDRLRAPLAR
ncbi:MAG TPA: 1-acyl-sn-glycerol-3-phosphate acyltransferase [Gemmatimonadaceae bacterium]|nr:1-acyl-sn-glycerol-3-phosphate acyltransferase [Gemmatimonadaceae bacterium]